MHPLKGALSSGLLYFSHTSRSIPSTYTISLSNRYKPLPRPVIRRLMTEIRIIKLSIMPTLAHQTMMTTLLDNPATIKNNDAVRVPHGREAMSDQNGCAVLQNQVKPFLDLRLGQWINAGGRFIQDDD